jgi:putative protein kinase ArgK-like GTPase of G3E family
MKKGIVELSDLILVNKSDGVLEGPARIAQVCFLTSFIAILISREFNGNYTKSS